jgi:glutamate-1-semialdehyde 2,1-aminomutase
MGEIFTPSAAASLFDLGETMRRRLNEVCARAGVAMQFTGLGSLAAPHFRTGPITAPYTLAPRDEAIREIFFFDMLEAGIYLARRGMVALMLPTTEDDVSFYVEAVGRFVEERAELLAE